MINNDKLESLRHSAEHVLTMAMLRLYPGLKAAMGPATAEGFYFDFDSNVKISEEDFQKIEKEMEKIIKENLPIIKDEMTVKEAKEFFSKNIYKNNEYKHEWLDQIESRGEKVSVYWMGEKGKDIPETFVDICAGPHVKSTGEIKAFKLMKVAGAYWHGDEKNKMLTRIYGTAFENKKDLEDYLKLLEEAEKRDHKKLGKELRLFTISNLVGKGLPMYLPKGNIIRTQLENFIRKEKEDLGYSFVTIPHIAKKELYIKSGHMGKYDAMMPIMTDENGEEFVMKAMNCPHHFEIYNAEQHSYRDLPFRIAENTTVYRNEKSGELAGLLRVKNLTQDDTHHCIRPDQIESEIEMIFGLMQKVYKIFGFDNYKVEISVRDLLNKEKYFGSDEVWEKAEKILVNSAKKMDLQYSIEEGEAAFYGPKIDIKIKDSIGREWQLATIQLDFNQPNNFEMDYIGEDGKKHRIVVLHVAIFGSLERFIGILIEHYAGAFPLWLSPVQVKVIPVRTNHNEYAKQIFELLKENNIRAELDDAEANLGGKVRDAKNNKIPYWVVIGDKEIEANKITLESRDKGQLGQITKEELVEKLTKEIKEKTN